MFRNLEKENIWKEERKLREGRREGGEEAEKKRKRERQNITKEH